MQNHKRIVKVKFGPNQEICTVNRKGEKLRRVNVAHVDTLVVEITQDQRRKPMVLLRPPLDHDLVLEFDTEAARNKFLNKLEQFLISLKKGLDRVQTNKEQMLANAETKERRTKRLEHFFREAYELTFGLKPGEKRKLEDAASDVVMVMRTSLSKKEFAGALGMKPDDIFVRRMFNIVDKDGDGRISFQEFLDTVVLFSKGSTDDKLRIIFDMCDNDRNGVIDKTELSEMLRSLVEIAKTNTVSDEEVRRGALVRERGGCAGTGTGTGRGRGDGTRTGRRRGGITELKPREAEQGVPGLGPGNKVAGVPEMGP